MARSWSQRLFDKVDVQPDGCWIWTASVRKDGYGQIWTPVIDGRRRLLSAHRAMWELLRGAIPAGKDLDHLCRVHLCVNPDHLEPVARRENVLRGIGLAAQNARLTACREGHEFAVARSGRRYCPTCVRARQRRTRAGALQAA